MPFLISSSTGARGILSGEFVRARFDSYNVRTRIYLPPAVTAMSRYSSWRVYSNRVYFAAAHFTENLLLDEHYRMLRQGIRPPTSPPTVVLSGAGSTDQIFYLSFWDELTGERSSLSEGASATGGLTRTWSLLPTSVPGEIVRAEGLVNKTGGSATVTGVGAPAKTNFTDFRPGDRVLFSGTANRWTTIRTITDGSTMTVDDLGIAAVSNTLTFKAVSRCSHIELWVSVAGTLPRLAARVRLGTTDVVESVPTLSLGEAFLDNFEPMPNGSINTTYGDRQLTAGVPGHEDEVFLSVLFFPERWGGLSFKTRHGEPITGLIGADDYARVDTPDSSYILQGYTEDDLTMTVSNPSLGGFGHLTSIQIEENVWTPNRKSFYVYNGAWKPACEDRNTEWNFRYRQSPTAFETGFTVYNPNDATIQFYPFYRNVGQLPSETVWVADFSSVKFDAGGTMAQPYWMNDDYRSALDIAVTEGVPVTNYWGMAAYLIPDGQKVGKLYRVSFPGGEIYYENDDVAYERTAVAVPPHNFYTQEGADIGNNENHGYILDSLWINARVELSDMQIGVWAGDEYAFEWQARGLQEPTNINRALPQWPGIYPSNGFALVAATLQAHSILDPPPAPTYRDQPALYVQYAAKTVHYYRPQIAGRGHSIELRFPTPKQVTFLGYGGKILPGRASREVVNVELDGV